MIRALFDTNVLLDALADREGFSEDAKALFRLVAEEKIHGYISGSCITDIYYILRKEVGLKQCRYALGILLDFFTIVSVGGTACSTAFEMGWDDYEDAVVATCAISAKVDVLVTRDAKFLGSV
ncbi:MAG: PIN domain-containing protein [Planctomycetes bacterium]|nr:PIN domain-containing protein [Planctomycetota bacterium]